MLLLETVINRYLALDPEVLAKLRAFNGKVIKIDITIINKAFYMLPNETGIQVFSEFESEVDTVLRGSPLSLFKMGVLSDSAGLLLKGEVEISGDTVLGHRFKNVFNQMDIDWSEPLAEFMGDRAAFQLQQTGKQFGQWGQDTIRSFSNSVSEYLQEESRDAVTETELNIFNDSVDQLRDDVDRLQKKIQSLASTT